MKIRYATRDDFAAIRALAQAFIAESGLPGEYDMDRTERSIARILDEKLIPVILAEREGGVVGGVIATMEAAWTRDPWCYVQVFYVRPDWRSTLAARDLVESLCHVADQAGCAAIFAASTAAAGGKVDMLFTNLFAKYGFKPLGPTLMRTRS
jgi:N-acetylglutamate synthase-like GNAT family acetyltransferase